MTKEQFEIEMAERRLDILILSGADKEKCKKAYITLMKLKKRNSTEKKP